MLLFLNSKSVLWRINMKRDRRRSDKIGRMSEHIIFLALKLLKDENKITGFVQVNEPGRDFIIILLDKRKQPLEVKSSYGGKARHELHYGKTAAPVVVVPNFRGNMPDRERHRFAIRMKNEVLHRILRAAFP